jgi:hypothetical protein
MQDYGPYMQRRGAINPLLKVEPASQPGPGIAGNANDKYFSGFDQGVFSTSNIKQIDAICLICSVWRR